MAKKPPVNSMDEQVRQLLLRGIEANKLQAERDAAAAVRKTPEYQDNVIEVVGNEITEGLRTARAMDDEVASRSRDLAEHAQDAGVGLMTTLGTMGSTVDLARSLIVDSLANIPTMIQGERPTFKRTGEAFDRMNNTQEYWRDLETEKSKAFDRLQDYRIARAEEQADLESIVATGEAAGTVQRILATGQAAAEGYLDNPGQILTDSIAQLPYLATGGVAKGLTTGAGALSPLVVRLVAGGMRKQTAEKLVQMGVTGSLQGTVEGADAAAGAYAQVMASRNTFGPEDEASREVAALQAAAKAFFFAGSVSAITGTVASKFDLAPFGSVGKTAAARTTDNFVKALQEGFQETIESGTSQFATNVGANSELAAADRVFADQGVGAAMGTGLVVGAGSTVVTNPRAVVDAGLAPLTLGSKAVGYYGAQAQAAERKEDLDAAVQLADSVLAPTTPAAQAAVNDVLSQTVTTDTPAEMVEMPPEVSTKSPVHMLATGIEYLQGKHMDSEDAVTAFHVLGAVMDSAAMARRLLDGYAADARNGDLTPAQREEAQRELEKLQSVVNSDQLNKWLEEMPFEAIDHHLELLRQNPNEFGRVVSHLAAINPLKVSGPVLETALEAKGLRPEQKQSIQLARELKAAEDELRVGATPNTLDVSRSIMQTGFPGASNSKQSVADMLREITKAHSEGDTTGAQIYFGKLEKFTNYLQQRAADYEAAREELAASGPEVKSIPVVGYGTWDKTTGKYDKEQPPQINRKEGSQEMVKAVRKDADAVLKMLDLVQKRTGLRKGPAEPVAKPETPAAPAPKVEAAKAPVKADAAPATSQEEAELAALTDDQIGQELDQLTQAIRRRKNPNTAKALEQDIRYNNLVREQARRVVSRPEPQPIPAAAPIAPAVAFDEDTTGAAEATQEPTAADGVAEVVADAEPSKNQYTDLMPSYPVADGATVAEQNDAKNHLSQSFATSEQPGLVSKLPESAAALVDSLRLREHGAAIATKLFGLKDTLIERLNAGLAKKYGRGLRKQMLAGLKLWANPDGHSLYAARWDADGIAYDPVIAEVMAWTAIQHALDLVQPVKWSADKEAAFVATYGEAILPKLAQGWVPLAEQVHQVAQKLQRNLELRPDATVSREYTEGTMLALAMDALSTIMGKGRLLASEQIQMVDDGPLVQWVNLQADPDLWHDAARAMEGFFPERSSAAAGIVGVMPTEVNTFYRGSQQKIGKNQRKGLLKMSQTAHKLSPLMLGLWKALPNEAGARLFGYKPTADRPTTLAEIARDGANKTLMSDLKTIGAHIRAVEEYASQQEDGVVTEVPSYFEYEMVVNGRAMTKGTSPQSSKWYRELFSTVQETIDPSQDNTGFLMAVAQGLGIKMDKQPVADSLSQLARWLAQPSVKAAVAAAGRLSSGDLTQMDADIDALQSMKDDEGKAIELTEHGLTALVHMAAYDKGQPFVSSLSYEIDGLTDGPINLMMLLGLQGSAAQMEHWLGLGGLWFGEQKIAVQDKLDDLQAMFKGAKDLYEIIADEASVLNNQQAETILASVPKDQRQKTEGYLRAVLHLMHITKLSKSDLHALVVKHSRSFTKKPTQAAGYQQGAKSIINDLANSMLEALSERIDARDVDGNPIMTDMDWRAVDALFSRKLVYSKKKEQYFLIEKDDAIQWDGKPLSRDEFNSLTSSLFNFGGYGLANATLNVIGFQRMHMSSAVELVNAHIEYAQSVLRDTYKARQDAEVAAGRLHPGQALSTQDEQAITREVWQRLIPHPLLRNTGGLPVSSLTRNGVPVQDVRRVQSAIFEGTQNLQVSEASFEDPGVSFAALSIMASGDGSMMTGMFANNSGNWLNMYDGIYISPSQIDMVGTAINKEVKRNWEFDYIGAVLDSLKMDDVGFQAWAKEQVINEDGTTRFDVLQESVKSLDAQRQQQQRVMQDINSRPHSVSHMAGHSSPYWQDGQPLNSTTLGTSVTDPLLDLAADELGHAANGIRKLSKADVTALLRDHTFENPVLGGLWKVLAPLLSDDLTLFLSSDKQAMAEFYEQNERRQMGLDVDGVSIGDRVYVRAINAETLVHELLHATTKNLTATYFSKPAALTAQQRKAMENLVALKDQFLQLDPDTLPPHQRAMVEHVQGILRMVGSDSNAALQEFLAYGLSNYHLQRTLGNTKSVLGQLLASVFNAVKALFGFPNGTQSDSMLAHMLSNFEALTADTAGTVYPVTAEAALFAVNPDLARSFGGVLERMQAASFNMAGKTPTQLKRKYDMYIDSIKSINLGRTRMQEIADTGLFNFTNEQQTAAEYVQAMFAAGLQHTPDVNAILQRVVDAVRVAGPGAVFDQAQYDFFFRDQITRTPGEKYVDERAADLLALALVSPEINDKLSQLKLPQTVIEKGSFNAFLDSSAKKLMNTLDTGLAIGKDASLAEALEVAAMRMHKSALNSVKRAQTQPDVARRLTEKLSEGIQHIGDKAGQTAEARLKIKQGRDWISTGFLTVAGLTNDNYADMLGKTVLSITNHMEKGTPLREVLQEMVGTVSDNFRLIQLKGIAARMISAIRQSFREQTPQLVKGWFADLTAEQDAVLHKVIGRMAVYSLSQPMKDRLVEILTDPTNAMLDVQTRLMASGNPRKRTQMIKSAKQLGDYMADKGQAAVYLNTAAIAGLAVHGGGDALTAAEMAALEDLSTLQALTHLSPVERRMALDLVRNQGEAFWKTAVLVNSFQQFDTQRAGQQTATLNFQKGWFPSESDTRRKVKVFLRSEVRKAERMGWVVVGDFKPTRDQQGNLNDTNLVYMATTVGKTPTLSGGAVHAVDLHMNGIHFHSGLRTDNAIQTVITDARSVAHITGMLQAGIEAPYTALYDAAGDVVGFQRLLDPEVVARHTREVKSVAEGAGIWLGRLHEERTAHELNEAAATLLADTWKAAQGTDREDEFVDIRSTKDKVLHNVWRTLPYHTKVQLERVYANGQKDPPIMIRRDQLNDAVGYHKAGVSNFFTGDNRISQPKNDQVAALARQFLGKDAYKYLVNAEDAWQGFVASAKDTVIIKSLVVALNNIASNQIQLMMITGNPVWNLRVQAQKHKEVLAYLGYQQRIARLTAEGLSTLDGNRRKQIDAEQAQLKKAMQALSIHSLIEAGELPSIAEGLSETEEFSMMGDFTAWAEKQLGKLPTGVQTVVDNLVVAKHTSLYKGLDRLVQYGDFVAKATMYEWLTTQQGKSHEEALMEVNDEFVNYARLAGRMRTYGEDMGLLWFYNYKLRIMKMVFRRMRKNPVGFLIGSQVGGMLGIQTLVDSLPWNVGIDYSTGIDPLFSAHQSVVWNQLW